jgi:hypothetical protein
MRNVIADLIIWLGTAAFVLALCAAAYSFGPNLVLEASPYPGLAPLSLSSPVPLTMRP